MNKMCAISSWISFLTSADIGIHAEMRATKDALKRAAERREQSWPREIAAI
jgi:hypothetical protein